MSIYTPFVFSIYIYIYNRYGYCTIHLSCIDERSPCLSLSLSPPPPPPPLFDHFPSLCSFALSFFSLPVKSSQAKADMYSTLHTVLYSTCIELAPSIDLINLARRIESIIVQLFTDPLNPIHSSISEVTYLPTYIYNLAD